MAEQGDSVGDERVRRNGWTHGARSDARSRGSTLKTNDGERGRTPRRDERTRMIKCSDARPGLLSRGGLLNS